MSSKTPDEIRQMVSLYRGILEAVYFERCTDLEFPRGELSTNDILLKPQSSQVLPGQVSLMTCLTPLLKLNIPIISAAMDTVTEYALAIALAYEGGMGVIHKNMTIKEQLSQVERVKKELTHVINQPRTIQETETVQTAMDMMEKYGIHGLVVLDVNGNLAGIITNRDVELEKNPRTTLVRDKMTKGEGVITIKRCQCTDWDVVIGKLDQFRIEKLPVVDDNGRLVGMITKQDLKKRRSFPNALLDENGNLVVGAAVSPSDDVRERVQELVMAGVNLLTVDSAHGDGERVIQLCAWIKESYPDIPLVGGNVCTPTGTLHLIEQGLVDCVKVGVGPGSICTTREVAGVGGGQFTATLVCSRAARKHGKIVIADGGIRSSGDIVKLLAAGANAVMLGGILGRTEDAPGEISIEGGVRWKNYRGMGSKEAMDRGSQERYSQKEVLDRKRTAEGVSLKVRVTGTTSAVSRDLCGGIRQGMGYMGAKSIPILQQRLVFGTQSMSVQTLESPPASN